MAVTTTHALRAVPALAAAAEEAAALPPMHPQSPARLHSPARQRPPVPPPPARPPSPVRELLPVQPAQAGELAVPRLRSPVRQTAAPGALPAGEQLLARMCSPVRQQPLRQPSPAGSLQQSPARRPPSGGRLPSRPGSSASPASEDRVKSAIHALRSHAGAGYRVQCSSAHIAAARCTVHPTVSSATAPAVLAALAWSPGMPAYGMIVCRMSFTSVIRQQKCMHKCSAPCGDPGAPQYVRCVLHCSVCLTTMRSTICFNFC